MPQSSAAPKTSNAVNPSLMDQVRRYFEARDLIRRGICYLHAGLHADAAALFLAARERHSDLPALASLLATSYLGQGQTEAAAKELETDASRDPENVAAQIKHAMARWRSGQRHQAVGILRDVLRREPNCASVHFHLGSFLGAFEDWETAELHLTQAVAIDKNYTDALISLAMLHAAQQKPTEAAKLLLRAQRLAPANAKVGWLLSLAMQASRAVGHPLEADVTMPTFEREDQRLIHELRHAISHEPEFAEALFEEASGDAQLNRLVCDALEQLQDSEPHNPWLVFYLARTLERQGHYPEALNRAHRALELDPNFTQALVLVARLHHKIGELDSARAYLEQAANSGVQYADVYFMLGNIYRERGLLTQARSAYERALGINGRYEAARQALNALAA